MNKLPSGAVYFTKKLENSMKKFVPILSVAALIIVCFASCEIVGGIFKAGVWTGILFVVAVAVLIIYSITSVTKRK